eukprot:CAMPEP_0205828434 /NCGR_PEP_ID=MMETSP0206-20130828/35108_1 /ASSEMBLY_ACC=CAM_ASM_000279 /TAXON_ID=36767 /ORGANISM="Euplotes focardii, Strain TN1" /LENGTH=71 /DNA_ID=CAMNT_0053130247 /DNA_START=16 /DNA_END=229 /DNA_ORIENTATION=+
MAVATYDPYGIIAASSSCSSALGWAEKNSCLSVLGDSDLTVAWGSKFEPTPSPPQKTYEDAAAGFEARAPP